MVALGFLAEQEEDSPSEQGACSGKPLTCVGVEGVPDELMTKEVAGEVGEA